MSSADSRGQVGRGHTQPSRGSRLGCLLATLLCVLAACGDDRARDPRRRRSRGDGDRRVGDDPARRRRRRRGTVLRHPQRRPERVGADPDPRPRRREALQRLASLRGRADRRDARRATSSVATFRLTERPGPGVCGQGTGETAQTAFVIEDGEIVEWRRVVRRPASRRRAAPSSEPRRTMRCCPAEAGALGSRASCRRRS